MQLFLLLLKVKIDAPACGFNAPRRPLIEDLANAHHARAAGHQNVEVAGKSVLQRRHFKQLLHQLFRISAALEIDGNAQAAQIRFIADIVDFAHFPLLAQLHDLVNDQLNGGRIGNLIDLYDVFFLHIAPLCPYPEASAAGSVNGFHLAAVVDNFTAGREVRCRKRFKQIAFRIA